MIMKDTHVIQLECVGCHKDNQYAVKLPTAMTCKHCGQVFEVRLALRRSKKN